MRAGFSRFSDAANSGVAGVGRRRLARRKGIIGTGRCAIGTLVERSSRSTILRAPASAGGLGREAAVKNGPPFGGYGAAAMNAALTTLMNTLPEQLNKTLSPGTGGRNSPVMPSSHSIPARECSSPTRSRPGNDRRT